MVVGRLARHADVPDAQFGLRRGGPVEHARGVRRGGGGGGNVSGSAGRRRARRLTSRRTPLDERRASASCVASPAATTVIRDGANIAPMKCAHFVEPHRPQRLLGPDWQVAVGM